MRHLITAAIFTGSIFLAANASAQSFTEMPNNTGTYIADFGSVSGWKVVGIGTRDSSACSAFKGELDTRRPPTVSNYLAGNVMLINVDTAFIFQRDVPYSRIQVENPIRLHVTGRYNMTDDNYEWRWQGDKFFTPLKRGGQFNIDKMRREKTEFGNYMAFKHEWLTFVYRKTKRGSDDTYFVIDMDQFGEVKRSKRLEMKIGDRKTSLGTSRHAANRFGENSYPFTSLFLTSDDYNALNNGSLRIKAKYRGEKLDFEITDFKQAEDYRVKWNQLNPSR